MDELDKLRAALKAETPPADPAAKAAALARALENFEATARTAQETAPLPRPMSDRPSRAGFMTGVRDMLSSLTTRTGLAATASVVALCVGLAAFWPTAKITPAPKVIPTPESAPIDTTATTAPDQTDADGTTAGLIARDLTRTEPTAQPAPEPARQKADAVNAPAMPMAEADALAKKSEAPAAAPMAKSAAPALAEPAQTTLRAVSPEQALPVHMPDTEAFANADINPVKITAETPVSTFSIDVDTASYSVIRSSLTAGALPPPAAVRIEEMVNYFPYDYPAPKVGDAPFKPSVSLFQTPWNKNTELLRIGLQGAIPATADRPPLNLVFLIDTSGSMQEANKLPLLKQSFRLMLSKLRPEDKVAIVTYAGSAGEVLTPTAASDQTAILGALDRLEAGGSTAGAEGLQLAYQVADQMKAEGRIGRILLATDGDFNVGIDDPAQLTDFIAKKRDSGTYLSVLGFGRGNLDDAVMQALAQNGNGQAAYIDTLAEAQKVLVDQLTGALFPIANDVKVQVEFNPAAVAEYRLIGYETRALNREDFNNDRVDAGEIGAGLQVTALYEVTPGGSPAQLSDPLRYGAPAAKAEASELGFLKLRYKTPGQDASKLIEAPIPLALTAPDTDARFAAAIAGFGQLLTGGKYLGHWGWTEAIDLANGARGDDPFGYRTEAVRLMRLGQSLSR